MVSIAASILETITISSIFPFMSLVSNPEQIYGKYYKVLYDVFGFSSPVHFIVTLGIVIIILFIIKTIFNTFSTHVAYSFGNDVVKNTKTKLLINFLHQKYIYYLRDNRSSVIELHNNVNHLANAISSLSIIITEIFIVVIMYIVLMIFNWKIMTAITLFLLVNIVIVQKVIQPRLKRISANTWSSLGLSHKFLSAIVNNYKIVKLSSKDKCVDDYGQLSSQFHDNDCKRVVLERQPKNILELSGFLIMIGLVIYQELKHGLESSNSFIPMISLLMLTFYRLLPSITRIIDAKNSILHVTPIVNRVTEVFARKQEAIISDKYGIHMKHNLELRNIGFSYSKNKQILSDISLTINQGEHIAFIGSSGSGKSTLVDILMGFYDHDEDLYHFSGDIVIDGVVLSDNELPSWRQSIGYIPQEIYLFDGTVADNIVMNHEYDEAKIILALKKASIWEFLEQKEGVHTYVGDSGVMLSGGQKQRIGIARALYNDPDIIVMDEATSALDDYTESQIVDELNNSAREKTIIMIAHRMSSLKNCDKIYKLNKGIINGVYNNTDELSM